MTDRHVAVASTSSTDPQVTQSRGGPTTGRTRRPRRRSLAVPVGAVLLAVAIASPVSAHVGSGKYKLRTIDLTAGDGASVGNYLSCPKGKRIVSGGAFWHRPGQGRDAQPPAFLRSSTATTDGKGWYAAGRNDDDLQLQLRIVALCLPKKKVGTYSLRTQDLVVASGGGAGGYVSCPSGKRIVGGGAFWHRPGEGPDAQLGGYLDSSTATTNGQGWYASGRNFDVDTLQLRLVAQCVKPR
jgi:hypothetical protein